MAGLPVEQAELRLQDDAGHLGVDVVADADRLAVDGGPEGRVLTSEPAVLSQAGVEDRDDRTRPSVRLRAGIGGRPSHVTGTRPATDGPST